MRMGRPSSSHRLPVHRRHCSACASFHPDSNVHMSHYMHACGITHVTFTSGMSITISTAYSRHQQASNKSVSTRPPAALLSWIPTLPPSASTNKRQITFFSPVALSARNTRPRPPRPPIATLRPCLFLTLAHRRRHARVHLIPKIIFRNTPGPARLQHYFLLARRMLPPSADLPPSTSPLHTEKALCAVLSPAAPCTSGPTMLEIPPGQFPWSASDADPLPNHAGTAGTAGASVRRNINSRRRAFACAISAKTICMLTLSPLSV